MNKFGKNLALWIIIALLLVALFNLYQSSANRAAQPPIAYSDFIDLVDKGQVTRVQFDGRQLDGQLVDGRGFSTIEPGDPTLVQHLIARKVHVKATATVDDGTANPMNILVSWFPLLVIAGAWYYLQRRGLRIQAEAVEALNGVDLKRRFDQLETQIQALTTQVAEMQRSLSQQPSRPDEI